MNRRLTAALLITAAVLTNLAFTALGTAFDYPDVLKEPVDDVLTAFRDSQTTVVAAAHDSFATAHRILGTVIGETFGYLLTAAWSLLVLAALGRTLAGRWFTALGTVSAVLVLAGVLSPLSLPLIDQANFFGYILWSAWLVAFAVLLLRPRRPGDPATTTEPALSGVGS
jgi:hypothetical protein